MADILWLPGRIHRCMFPENLKHTIPNVLDLLRHLPVKDAKQSKAFIGSRLPIVCMGGPHQEYSSRHYNAVLRSQL